MRAIVLCFLVLLAGCIDYSDGIRAGTVVKFSRKGILCKTWEGEMVLGGMRVNDDGNSVANIWQFTVTDPIVVEQVLAAQESGQRVRLHYKQEAFASPCRSISGGYFVDRVNAEGK